MRGRGKGTATVKLQVRAFYSLGKESENPQRRVVDHPSPHPRCWFELNLDLFYNRPH